MGLRDEIALIQKFTKNVDLYHPELTDDIYNGYTGIYFKGLVKRSMENEIRLMKSKKNSLKILTSKMKKLIC